MGLLDIFRPVKVISVAELRKLMAGPASAYNLVDVRQPQEYVTGHIPGAHFIPLDELSLRTDEIKRALPTVAYCRSGRRSRSAAALLLSLGFQNAMSLDGGIDVYNGAKAEGGPEAMMTFFPEDANTAKLTALCWLLEDGTEKFYEGITTASAGQWYEPMMVELTMSEDAHKLALTALYSELVDEEIGQDFPYDVVEKPKEIIMEGGVKVIDALFWAEDRDIKEIIDLMMTLEANAQDLYTKMARRVSDKERSARLFKFLAEEERQHIVMLGAALEEALKR